MTRVGRWLTVTIGSGALALGAPQAAIALRVSESLLDDTVEFDGRGCGARDTYDFSAPRGAYRVRSIGPALGSPFADAYTSLPVARLVEVRYVLADRGRRAVRYVAAGSDNACTNPGAYPYGWSVREGRAEVSYRINRRVRFRSYIMGSYTTQRYRPPRIRFGERSGILGIRWSRWDGRAARGRGTLLFNSCVPNCAQARPQRFRVAITLSRVRNCGFADRFSYHYTRFAFRYIGAKPAGVGRRYAERHSCR